MNIRINQGQKHRKHTLSCSKWLTGSCGAPIYEQKQHRKHERISRPLQNHQCTTDSLCLTPIFSEILCMINNKEYVNMVPICYSMKLYLYLYRENGTIYGIILPDLLTNIRI